jgi:hypothetical protein
MSELSPERQELLKSALDIQARMLDGVTRVFQGLSTHRDEDVSFVSKEVLGYIQHNRDILDAMIDSLTATQH